MAAPATFAWTFRDVAVRRVGTELRAYFAAGHDKSVKQNLPVTFFFRWAGKWSSKAFAINATGICVTPGENSNSLMMGVDGAIVRGMPTGFAEEHVDASDQGPRAVGHLREIRTIGEHAYVAGMARMVYRCDGPNAWQRIDQGTRCKPGDMTTAGFNSIHGFGDDDIYAVGWNGEIWRRTKRAWKKLASPTKLALFRVVCGGDGTVYACGQLGTIVAGRATKWSLIEHDATREDFWGATWFKGKLYLSTTNGLFVLADGAVEPLEIRSAKKLKLRRGLSFERLASNDDIMWSAGDKMAMWTEDGRTWTEVPYR